MGSEQTDANTQTRGKALPTAFDPFVKEHALKILMDYSGATRRKWTTIGNEILRQSSRQPTANAPLLNRQDLESWARGDSMLGDEKFRLVYEFLTHPATLARPELAHASVLKEPFHKLLRIGRGLAEFYSDFDRAIGRELFEEPLGSDEVRERANALSGIYVGIHRGQHVCLSFERLEDEQFYIVHYLVSPTGFGDTSADWNLDRHSGYLTVGNMIIAHLKGVLTSHNRMLWILRPRDWGAVASLEVVTEEVTSKALQTVAWDTMIEAKKRLPYINPFDYTFRVTRTNSTQLRNLIANFRWRVPA